MQYLIDGYNVTKLDPVTRDLPLEDQRTALERRIQIRGAALLGKGAYTIIWDGVGGVGVVKNAHDTASSHSHYTRRPTADDAIVETVRISTVRIGVVTSDHGLADRCRAVALHGVDILPAQRLFESAVDTRSAKGRKQKPIPRNVGIPSGADEINRELRDLWDIEE